MRALILSLFLAILVMAALVAPAAAGHRGKFCLQRSALERMLPTQFGMEVTATGATHNSILAEIWVTPAGKWSFVLTVPRPDGLLMACIVEGGDGWGDVSRTSAPPEDPA